MRVHSGVGQLLSVSLSFLFSISVDMPLLRADRMKRERKFDDVYSMASHTHTYRKKKKAQKSE